MTASASGIFLAANFAAARSPSVTRMMTPVPFFMSIPAARLTSAISSAVTGSPFPGASFSSACSAMRPIFRPFFSKVL